MSLFTSPWILEHRLSFRDVEHRHLRTSDAGRARAREQGLVMAKVVVEGTNILTSLLVAISCRLELGKTSTSLMLVQVGLKGESMTLYSPSSIQSVDWTRESLVSVKQQPLTWYKVWVTLFRRIINRDTVNVLCANEWRRRRMIVRAWEERSYLWMSSQYCCPNSIWIPGAYLLCFFIFPESDAVHRTSRGSSKLKIAYHLQQNAM